ncbi:L,D-transpeptidase [Neoaquamicrobium sediminum]|uniref:L,D-transpeptidase n=1 Tax=Neoaquamicrobium sediminum TaxID=1849104 RepID=UPI001FD28BB8|nr:L,D-transpeptidase [Mesorhizobium sediminum]
MFKLHLTRAALLALASTVALSACSTTPREDAAVAAALAYTQSESKPVGGNPAEMYAARNDGGFTIPAVDAKRMKPEHVRKVVNYRTSEKPGTIVVDQTARYLYFVLSGGKAIRYAVGVGPVARAFPGGEAEIAWKAKWPRWTPTQNMIERNPKQYARNAGGVDGGPHNPMGARALYMHQNGVDTYYRVHGTNDPTSIGKAVSAGCIRLLNQDIIDLHDRVRPGAKIVVH